MLQGGHSAILLTLIKLPIVLKTFDLSIFEWPFQTGFIVYYLHLYTILFDFSLTVKAAPRECIIRTGQPQT